MYDDDDSHTPVILAMDIVTVFSKGAANFQGRGKKEIFLQTFKFMLLILVH
jgi:hypothetical protein